MSRWGLPGLLAVALLSSAAHAAPQPGDRLTAAVKAYEAANAGGEDDDGGGAEAQRWRLPVVGPAADAARKARLVQARSLLDGVDLATLTPDQRLTAQILRFSLDERIEGLGFDESRMPFSSDGGFDVALLYRANGMRLKSEAEARKWLDLIATTPDWYAVNLANARRGMASGFVQAVPTAQSVLDRARRTAATPVAEEPLLAPLRALPASVPADRKAVLIAEGEALLATRIAPARAGFVSFMETEYLPKAAKSLAASDLPDGRRYYAYLARRHTTTSMTPDQIHDLGQSEVARIRARMQTVMTQTGFTGTLPEFITYLRKDPKFYATSRQQLLEKASEIAKRADDQLPAHFGVLPRLSYGVRPVPASIEKGYTTGRYFGGDPKAGRAGGLMINTSELDQRALYELPALVLHEGAPGHHTQTSLAQEQTDVPEFRKGLYFNAFGEGWGLYSEWLGEEMGIYRDPYELFGRLSYEMWRACRLVADTGLHWKHWSLEQARACFTDNTALSPVNIEVELARYVSWPGQALAYKVGELKILELRHRAEAALGDRFDERRFHDAVLLQGSLPMAVLEQRIDAWIADQKKG
ncbi:DUF885 domain-containing protein [Caulobacter sp. HMWF009]|uniref:DUF885 domain-containing protein n=1 Tax=unclassified Caulobacter TaxID=2648921 RepID=UPI000D35210A|nr:DUF885 domain-containing protein [Caulobacter sp. HMWF009]PTT04997.1 DUF885 domain-containing protein [Caulobacter sp. HMWF025]